MARHTSPFSVQVPTTAIKLIDKNPYRLLYSIQNLDAANYIALGHNAQVTAGVYGAHEGQHLAAGQPMSDDTDQDVVWAIANTAAVNISGLEINESPPAGNPRSFTQDERRRLRQEARTF